MLKLQAIFERKISEFPLRECVIEKAVELPEAEYSRFRSGMLPLFQRAPIPCTWRKTEHTIVFWYWEKTSPMVFLLKQRDMTMPGIPVIFRGQEII